MNLFMALKAVFWNACGFQNPLNLRECIHIWEREQKGCMRNIIKAMEPFLSDSAHFYQALFVALQTDVSVITLIKRNHTTDITIL